MQSSPSDRRKKVIRQVEKLMALSESSNEAEATLAAEKASALVMKFMINEEELKTPASRRQEKPVEKMIYYRHYEIGFVRILNRISDIYGVVTIHDSTGGHKHGRSFAIGFHTEIELVDRLFQRLHRVAWDECRSSWVKSPHKPKGSWRGYAAYRNGFLAGFATRIGVRLKASVEDTFAAEGSSTDLVLVPRAERSKKFADELHPTTRTIPGERHSNHGLAAGHQFGDQVSLANAEIN